jgi:hypothetical protein
MAGRTATCCSTFLLFSDLLAPLHEMPGPRNQKKHRGSEAKRPKKKGAAKGVIAASLAYAEVVEIPPTNAVAVSPKAASVPDASLRALSLETAYVGSLGPNDASDLAMHASSPPSVPPSPPLRTPSSPSGNYDEGFPPPCIEDPGSGPRVRDAVAFLSSPFAVRSADETDAPLCAELAQGEVLFMVREVLPEELAIVCHFSLPEPDELTNDPVRWCGITVHDGRVASAQLASVYTL